MSPRTRTSCRFADGIFQRVECDAVLEHVRDPEEVMREIARVLAPGGIAHLVTPFCHPFHEYPKDYRRFTPDGLKELAGGMEVVAEGWRTGPTATLLVFTIEYVKLLLPWRAWRVAAHGVLGMAAVSAAVSRPAAAALAGRLPDGESLLPLGEEAAVGVHGRAGGHRERMVIRPSQVGAQDSARDARQAVEDVGVRMPVAVFKARGDHGERRVHGAEELLRAGGPAAMVRHLQDVACARASPASSMAPLDLPFHVAAEQEARAGRSGRGAPANRCSSGVSAGT